ncbi:MAG: iron chaperone [Candidatus Bathyarchaeia archaeon]|jgi:uncharacterized protein YdhG (YjbR/CyaY superfamily)
MKANRTSQTVNEYIAAFPQNVQTMLQELRRTIKEAAPNAEETISYQMPAFKLNGRILVYFAAFKNHIGFYPTASAVEAFKEKLAKYQTSKGTVKFLLNQPTPTELVKEMVRFRVEEILRKKGKREREAP